MAKFMNEMIDDLQELWESATEESFLQEMSKGILDNKKFLNYIIQDSLYLRDYLKAYAMGVFKGKTLKEMQMFYSVFSFFNDSENETRVLYLKDNGMTDLDIEGIEKEPECVAYTKFLIDTSIKGETPEILMAIMPCMIGYYYVFKKVLEKNPKIMETYYAPLVKDYTTDSYKECCDFWTDYCNEVCDDLDKERKINLKEIIKQASLHELYFWQMAGREI